MPTRVVFDNRRGNRFGRTYRVSGHDTALHIQQLQQLRNRGDLIFTRLILRMRANDCDLRLVRRALIDDESFSFGCGVLFIGKSFFVEP
jgi:hypothetical protein